MTYDFFQLAKDLCSAPQDAEQIQRDVAEENYQAWLAVRKLHSAYLLEHSAKFTNAGALMRTFHRYDEAREMFENKWGFKFDREDRLFVARMDDDRAAQLACARAR